MTTPVIKATQAADFLALVPALAGFTPEQSLLLIGFTGNRTNSTARFDAAPALADPIQIVDTWLTLHPTPEIIDAVVPVLYIAGMDDALVELGGLLRDVYVPELEGRDLRVRDFLLVGDEVFTSAIDASQTLHPRMKIAMSPAAADSQAFAGARAARTIEEARAAGEGIITTETGAFHG